MVQRCPAAATMSASVVARVLNTRKSARSLGSAIARRTRSAWLPVVAVRSNQRHHRPVEPARPLGALAGAHPAPRRRRQGRGDRAGRPFAQAAVHGRAHRLGGADAQDISPAPSFQRSAQLRIAAVHRIAASPTTQSGRNPASLARCSLPRAWSGLVGPAWFGSSRRPAPRRRDSASGRPASPPAHALRQPTIQEGTPTGRRNAAGT